MVSLKGSNYLVDLIRSISVSFVKAVGSIVLFYPCFDGESEPNSLRDFWFCKQACFFC